MRATVTSKPQTSDIHNNLSHKKKGGGSYGDKLYLPYYVVQEDEGTPTLSQQQMSQEACWLADVQYQDAGKKITRLER
jgi:hypothetical protein